MGGAGAEVWRRAAVGVWPILLTGVLLAPMLLEPGHFLARDLVFLPRHEVSWAAAGLSDSSPRAVPLDLVVGAVTSVVDGGVVARVVLPLLPLLAAWGVVRLAPGLSTAGVLTATGVAVWNPFVVERLALGQWALLVAYAALPWMTVASLRWSESRNVHHLAAVVGWGALASLTPTGGLLATGTAAAVVLTSKRRAREPASWAVVVAVSVLQMPWVVTALTGSASLTSDPAGVQAFAPDSEGPGGPWVALLGLGGIWDARSEPASRLGPWGVLTAVAVVVLVLVVIAGRRRGRVPAASPAERVFVLVAATGSALAFASTLPPLQDVLEWMVVTVPGAGLLRDAQKWLLPGALVVATWSGVVADRLAARLRFRLPHSREVALSLLAPVVVSPLILLPDGASAVWQTVRPVRLPDGLDVVAERVQRHRGDVVTLPWRSYRWFEWGNGESASDPALRLMPEQVVTDGALVVGDRVVRGESRRAREVGEFLRGGESLTGLGERGIRWVLVYRDDPHVEELDLDGLAPVHQDAQLALLEVPDVSPRPEPTLARRIAVVTGYAVPALVLLGLWLVVALRAVLARRRRNVTTGQSPV